MTTITIEFRKLRLSQNQSGHTVTFEFDPKGMDALISAPLGTVYMCQLQETESGEFTEASLPDVDSRGMANRGSNQALASAAPQGEEGTAARSFGGIASGAAEDSGHNVAKLYTTPFKERPLSQQCALRCNDVRFQTWILSLYPDIAHAQRVFSPERATAWFITAAIVRKVCGVKSRSEILDGTDAGDRWKTLDATFWQHLTEQNHAELVR